MLLPGIISICYSQEFWRNLLAENLTHLSQLCEQNENKPVWNVDYAILIIAENVKYSLINIQILNANRKMLLLDANLHNEGKKRMTAAAAHFLFFTFLDEVKFSKATLCTTWQLSEKIVHPRFFYQELAWQHAKLCNIIGKS